MLKRKEYSEHSYLRRYNVDKVFVRNILTHPSKIITQYSCTTIALDASVCSKITCDFTLTIKLANIKLINDEEAK